MGDSDFQKQYIVQAILNAANNLRLSSEKIEVVTLIKEHFLATEDLFSEIQRLKTITEFSKFAIKLNELYNYVSGGAIDFLKVSDRFKEHSFSLVRDLSLLLDVVNPTIFNELVFNNNVSYELKEHRNEEFGKEPENIEEAEIPDGTASEEDEYDEDKEKFILEDLQAATTFNFENYLQSILKPVKSFDYFLERVLKGNFTEEELDEYYDIFRQNALLSQKAGLEIVKKMHRILYESLFLIRNRKLSATARIIDSMRASLIVIVAIVRQKEVDISNFLKKAEYLDIVLDKKLKEE